MKTFRCVCGQLLFFHNVCCVSCHRGLGFFPETLTLSALEPTGDGLFVKAGEAQDDSQSNGTGYRKCQNYAQQSVCNWMIHECETGEVFCKSCRLTETIPDLTQEQNLALWAALESAKRRLIYSLLNLKLPILTKREDAEQGLMFRFLSDVTNPDGSITKAMTGHDNGVITLNIAEADDAVREKSRLEMKEPYRTLLGHFRHEAGHYYWDRLVKGRKCLERFRLLFGDEQADYGNALKEYYAKPGAQNWQENYISAYATSHPWEDWAETWAHFLHIQDTLEVAEGLGIKGKPLQEGRSRKKARRRGTMSQRFEGMVSAWSDLVIALNSINRSMGHQDLYPFVITPRVAEKLRFVADVISDAAFSFS